MNQIKTRPVVNRATNGISENPDLTCHNDAHYINAHNSGTISLKLNSGETVSIELVAAEQDSIIGQLLLQSGKKHLAIFPKHAISYIILDAA